MKAYMSQRKERCDNPGLAPCIREDANAWRALREAQRILAETEPEKDYLGIEPANVALSLHAPWMLRGACYSALADGIRSFIASEVQ